MKHKCGLIQELLKCCSKIQNFCKEKKKTKENKSKLTGLT